LDGFLTKLGHDWKGWRRTRRWETFRGEFSIDATHRGRVVEFLFVLRVPCGRNWEDPRLEVRLPVLVPPGEQLSRIVDVASQFA
jgi:hypothetical protein